MALDKKNLLYRTVTGALGIVLLLCAFYYGGLFFSLLITAISFLAYAEYVQITRKMGKHIPYILGGLAGVAFMLNKSLGLDLGWGLFLVPLFVLMCFEMIIRYPEMKFDDLTMGFFGVFYIFLLFSFFFDIRQLEHGFFWTLFVMVMIWVGDSAAYFVGVRFGKHRLAASLSPKKSVEGAIGALSFTILIGLLAGYFVPFINIWDGIVLGAIVSIAGIFGDLFESALKRTAGVKDSGKLLPGHGGILDRFDSTLFVIPLAYYLIAHVL
jgi:phosphatidate cytidylyltransferase